MMRNIIFTVLAASFFQMALMAQIQDKVDFTEATISIEIMPKERLISGLVEYKFKVLNEVDSIFFDAKNIDFSSVRINHKKRKFINEGKHLTIKKKFKKGNRYTVTLAYQARPKQALYFIGWDTIRAVKNRQVWTQGQGKYTSHWLPSFDDMNEKVVFDINITFDENYTVIANGKLIGKKGQPANKNRWSFDMQEPMSTYLLAFAIGNYRKETRISTSGIPILLYYYPQDSLKVAPTYRYSKEIFDFLEQEIEVPYPWQNYKQIPVKDFLYAGMENTSATLFSDAYVIDSTAFIDKNYVNVNAHELAHQWFGDLVTEVDGKSHWLHEGFATYYALLAEREIFGDAYFYWKLFDAAEQLRVGSENNEGEALANDKASSLTYYEKGAWALVMLRNEIGDDAFKKGIKAYLEKYKFKNVTIRDFIEEMEKASGKSLAKFESEWLFQKVFPYTSAAQFLKNNSESLAVYFEFKNKIIQSLDKQGKQDSIEKTFFTTSSNELRRHILLNAPQELITDAIYKWAFSSNNLLMRQAIALNMVEIPERLKLDFESLLHDESYSTVENALLKLWYNFPQDRKSYLENTKEIIGLPDKNVRLLWLTLALVTDNYNNLKTKDYFDELENYTNPEFSPEIRQKAFQYLNQAMGLTDMNLKDLVNATVHSSWQFKKFARTLLDELLMDEDYKNRIKSLAPMLNQEEKRYVYNKLGL